MGSFIDMTGWVMREHGFPNSRLTIVDRAPKGYKMTVLRDEMKKEYCSKNHIPLLILNKNNNLKVDIEIFINEVWD